VTSLVCLGPLHDARRELEKARRRYWDAAHALTTVRETLDQAVELAYQQQSFAPLGNLFNEEEAALAIYERAVSALAEAEERWLALSAALAHEKMLMGQVSRSRMN
jgi:exonuclease VII small subunit